MSDELWHAFTADESDERIIAAFTQRWGQPPAQVVRDRDLVLAGPVPEPFQSDGGMMTYLGMPTSKSHVYPRPLADDDAGTRDERPRKKQARYGKFSGERQAERNDHQTHELGDDAAAGDVPAAAGHAE